MDAILEMVGVSIEFQNNKVAMAALGCLEALLNNFPEASSAHVDKFLPMLLTRSVDSKQQMRDAACLILAVVHHRLAADLLLAGLDRAVERHRNTRARAKAVEFGNEVARGRARREGDEEEVADEAERGEKVRPYLHLEVFFPALLLQVEWGGVA